MQLQPNSLGQFDAIADVAGSPLPAQPDGLQPWHLFSPDPDHARVLKTLGGDRARDIWLVAGALVLVFASGWAGGSAWHGFRDVVALNPVAPKDADPRRMPEIKAAAKTDTVRKPAANPPPVSAAVIAASPQVPSPAGARLLAEPSSTAAAMVPVPETRPTTIEGWTVRDVRGGMAVLEGPDGVTTAARGDTVPGLGRIDSIVRWGNRWIVATASGLVATP